MLTTPAAELLDGKSFRERAWALIAQYNALARTTDRYVRAARRRGSPRRPRVGGPGRAAARWAAVSGAAATPLAGPPGRGR
jgi:hypothetical protein